MTSSRGVEGAAGNHRARLLAGLAATERRLDLAGISTAVIEGGDGPPVVMLHGPNEYAPKWFRVLPGLVSSYRVIAPDLPGHGDTEMREASIDPERVLTWLDELITQTCAAPPVLVGHIIGGAIAARYAARRSERIRQLVLVDALGLSAFAPAPQFGAAIVAYAAEPNEKTHDELWQYCAYDIGALRDEMGEHWNALRTYNLDRARATRQKPIQQALMEHFGFPMIPPGELAQIRAPTALIWGRHDLATRIDVAETASRRFGWPLHVIENAADDPPIEQPAAFVSALRDVLG